MSLRSISDVFSELKQSIGSERVSVDHILEGVHERGFGFLLLIFSLPLSLPFPKPPGTSTIFAIPLLLLTLQQMMGFHKIWIPGFIRRRTISAASFGHLIDIAIPWMKKAEALSHPRLGFVTQGLFSNFIGFLGVFMSLCIAIPFPLTNTVPGFGIALMALGIIMRDGLAVLLGALMGTGWALMLLYGAIFLGTEGIDLLTQNLKSFFI